MKYIFEMFHTPERKNDRDPAARFDRSILRIPGSGIAYATAHGRTEQIATYRADRLAAALTATQNMALNDIRRLAGWRRSRTTGGIYSCHSSGQ
jgi:hypothetical protein